MPPYLNAQIIFKSLRRINRVLATGRRGLSDHSRLTAPQLLALREISLRGACTPGVLAKCIYVSQSTLTVTLDHLEEMGLVRRERNTADKRVVTINLTDEGRREAATVSIPLLDFLSEKLSGMTDEDQVRVSVAMERLADLLDDNPDQKSRPKGRPDPL